MSEKLWSPSEEQLKIANMTKFMRFLKEKRNLDFSSYNELYDWSVSNRADFWESLWEFYDVIHSKSYDTVLENGEDMLGSVWFSGAELNFAENLLRYRDEHLALVFQGEPEDRPVETLTYNELYDQVAKLAKSLREFGLKPNDRVGAFLPNMNETVVAMLAGASLGAIWSSCSPDFGFQGVMDRFGQIEPRILFTADGYFYNGRKFDSLERVKQIVKEIPSIEKVVVVPYINPEPDISKIPNSVLYKEFLAKEDGLEINFEQLPFDHPVYILYSSGTTGVPKCMVHGAGGTLLQHFKELGLHSDLKREDKIFYFTTCGWMMWNWLVSALAVGATVLLFDGSPFVPGPERLFKFTDEQGMTVFGTSAKYIAAVENSGLKPREQFDLSALRAMLSTGSPLTVENFKFVYSHIKEDLLLGSISGGSDIVSCFALGNPVWPVHAGELQCRGLGMDVDVFDDSGKALKGEKGELVCKSSFPSQPIYFWNDPDKSKYKAAYFETYPNVWHHGDYAELTEHDGMIIYGRSDATLNPMGVRIGTAEIYRQVEVMEEIEDSLVVCQSWEDDLRVILFIKLNPGVEFGEEMIKKIKTTIRTNCTPRHVPAKIIPIDDIPYTISGKKVEIAVRKIIEGQEVLNRDALKNPEALELYADLKELKECFYKW
ncbi:MAG: acetoacetate--CoA ligase [Thermoplasmata archaeon]|nr:MAG: acetoacetate--CoA ligase [Thermoplasmata archaeon]